jgi:hypothetical protein
MCSNAIYFAEITLRKLAYDINFMVISQCEGVLWCTITYRPAVAFGQKSRPFTPHDTLFF